jgi:hypothetical protein
MELKIKLEVELAPEDRHLLREILHELRRQNIQTPGALRLIPGPITEQKK